MHVSNNIVSKNVTFETAKAAKENGFIDFLCNGYYEIPDKKFCQGFANNIDIEKDKIAAPTQEHLLKYIRDTYQKNIFGYCIGDNQFVVEVQDFKTCELFRQQAYKLVDGKKEYIAYKTYEEAIENGLYQFFKKLEK